ncbi:hypothetical protein AX16_005977 [Volvariella volvacea WC 439]|nr:hypothetical protein AX16_005977 [Volvariella volvacea WC 439]
MFTTHSRKSRGPSGKYGQADPLGRDVIHELQSGLCSAEGGQRIVDQLISKPNTKKLVLGHTELGDSGCEVLFAFLCSEKGHTYQISEISLNSNDIGNKGLMAISTYLKGNVTLKELFLQHNSFTADPVVTKTFVEALNTSRLEVLSLTTNRRLSDAFIEIFIPSLKTSYLRELHISAMGLTPASLPHLTSYLSSKDRCHLHAFKCNGNLLGFRAIRAIVNTIQRHNYNITTLELHANDFAGGDHALDGESGDDIGDDADEEPRHQRSWEDLQPLIAITLFRNQRLKQETQHQAVGLLKYCRALLLCSKFKYAMKDVAQPSDSTFSALTTSLEAISIRPNPFTALPVELQLHILSFLAPRLSTAQLTRIYNHASSTDTLPHLLPRLISLPPRNSPLSPASETCIPDPALLGFSALPSFPAPKSNTVWNYASANTSGAYIEWLVYYAFSIYTIPFCLWGAGQPTHFRLSLCLFVPFSIRSPSVSFKVPMGAHHHSNWDDIDEDDFNRDERPKTSKPHHQPIVPLKTIPDLRFESTYLRSLQKYVKVTIKPVEGTSKADPTTGAKEGWEQAFEKVEDQSDDSVTLASDESDTALKGPVKRTMEVEVQWKGVAWATVRDQILAPFLQGLVWALASSFITPLGAQAGAKAGTFIRTHLPTKEGLGIGWLRKWARGLGLSGAGLNTAGTFSRQR